MLSSFAAFNLGAPELVIILGIAVLLFGGKKLPQLARGIGESTKELKSSLSSAEELNKEVHTQVNKVKEDFKL